MGVIPSRVNWARDPEGEDRVQNPFSFGTQSVLDDKLSYFLYRTPKAQHTTVHSLAHSQMYLQK